MVEIKDIDDPRVVLYKSLRYTPISHIESQVFVAEGARPVQRLLESDLRVDSIFAVPKFYNEFATLLKQKNIPNEKLFYADKHIMEKIVGFHLHSGIMAIGYQPKDVKIEEFSDVVVGLNGINNSENVGSIVRNCRAFGIDSILVDERSTSPFLRRSVRVSMGNVFYIKVRHSPNFADDILSLKRNGYCIISCEILETAKDIYSFKFPRKVLLIFGNEGKGIDKSILDMSDFVVKIPISLPTESLNVAVSSAVFLNEINRQRRAK
ncbi:MAG: RNA methyltransferase [Ignavibacteria bacterium]|nr:RNA methyltransferase [Ignavibacteria bacterium]